MSKEISISAFATATDVQATPDGNPIPLFNDSPHILSVHVGPQRPGKSQWYLVATVSQALVDSYLATGSAVRPNAFVRRPNNSTKFGAVGDNDNPTAPWLLIGNEIWIALIAPIQKLGTVDAEFTLSRFTVEDNFDENALPATEEMTEALVSFDNPTAFVQDEILTPTNNSGVTEVKVTENLTNGLIVRVTFDRAFAHRDGYIADSQLAGFNGGVWDADDYATNNSKAGMVRRKSTDWVEIFIQKEVDLSTPRNYTVLCRGLATIA